VDILVIAVRSTPVFVTSVCTQSRVVCPLIAANSFHPASGALVTLKFWVVRLWCDGLRPVRGICGVSSLSRGKIEFGVGPRINLWGGLKVGARKGQGITWGLILGVVIAGCVPTPVRKSVRSFPGMEPSGDDRPRCFVRAPGDFTQPAVEV
jgi:hypothetical protein